MARLGRRQPNRPIVQHSLRRFGPPLGAPSADATGTAHQDRLFYAANGACWWLVWIDRDLPDALHLSWSTDLVSWTDAGTIQLRATLASNLSGTQSNNRWARNLGCAYKNIASTDVLYIWTCYAPIATDHSMWVQRVTLGAGTFAVTHAEAQIGSSVTPSNVLSTMGVAGAISTDNFAWSIGGYETTGLGNFRVQRATNADAGSSWTAGWSLSGAIGAAHSQFADSQAIFPVGASKMLGVMDEGSTATPTDDILQWSASPSGGGVTNWTAGGTPPDYANLVDTTADFDLEDWAACRVSDTDVHVVVRDPDNADAFLHKRWNGTTFGAGQSIPTQATKAGAGLFAASNGTDVWLFAIDSDAANTVRYVKWTAATPAWGTWTAFESTTQVRTALTGYRQNGGSNLGVMWTEDAGNGAFRIVTKPLLLSIAASGAAAGQQRSSGASTAVKGGVGAAAGQQRSSGAGATVKGAAGAAQGGQRVTGQTSGVKGAAAATLGPTRTAGLVVVRKQTTGSSSGQQRTSSTAAARKQAAGSTVGEQRTAGIAVRGVPAVGGAAIGQQRITGTTTGVKGTVAGAAAGQQRTAGQVAVRKQATGVGLGGQRTIGTTTVRKQALGATVGQQRTAGLAGTAPPPPSGAAVGQQRVAGQSAGRKGTAGAATGQTRTAGATTGIRRGVGTASGQQHTATTTAGAKGGRGAATGQQRTAGTAARAAPVVPGYGRVELGPPVGGGEVELEPASGRVVLEPASGKVTIG
jgi:hypothetical protein